MNHRYKILVVIIFLFILFRIFRLYSPVNFQNELNEQKAVNDLVKVTVYYEALCPDSKFFILHQLVPAYKSLRKFLILDLVPYGKAEVITPRTTNILINKLLLRRWKKMDI